MATSLRRAGALLVVLAIGLGAAELSHSTRQPHATTANRPSPPAPTPTAGGRLAAIKATTAISCSPARRGDALLNQTGPFCVPFDSIPAINHPKFASPTEVRLRADEPVISLDLGSAHRAYPVRIVERHEIVNDVVAGRPVLVTFCPLCNSPVAFSRVVAGRSLLFGVSGELNEANLIMFDRRTLSLWQQLTGRAITGTYEGRRLGLVPVQMVAFGAWRAAHPDGEVLIPPVNSVFSYGRDPYAFYDRGPSQQSIVVRGEPTDPRLPPKWRIVGVALRRKAVAFAPPVHPGPNAVAAANLGARRVVAFLRYGVRLAETGESFATARRGWSATVWLDRLGSRRLDLASEGGAFVDRRTGSRFDFLGHARSGPLAGQHLLAVPAINTFWFAWVHFHPRTSIIRIRR